MEIQSERELQKKYLFQLFNSEYDIMIKYELNQLQPSACQTSFRQSQRIFQPRRGNPGGRFLKNTFGSKWNRLAST